MDSDSDWRISCPTIRDKNLHSLDSGKFSDVTFLVGDTKERIHAHKYILVLSSPVFETQFGDRWNHEDEIEIPDVSPKSFRMFLEYLYADIFHVTQIEAPEVIFLAHKYIINCLVKKCTDLLSSVINVSNVILIHQTAAEFNEENLKKQGMEFILKNVSAVFEDIGFLQIDKDTLASLLKNDKLVTEEIVIFRALMRWAENKCKEEKLECTIENKRIFLKDLIPLIRFTLFLPEDFTNEVCIGRHEGILSDAESNSVYKYWNVGPLMRTRLPSLPFNVNKRCSDNIYKVDLFEIASGLLVNCRSQSTGSGTTHCEATLRFRSNRKIYLMGIELSNYSNYLAFTHTPPAAAVKPDIDISASLPESVTSSLDNLIQKKLAGLSVPSSSSLVRNEFSGVQIEKDVNYYIKLVINGGVGRSSMNRTSHGPRKILENPSRVICEEGDVEFTFNMGSTKCLQQDCDDDCRLDFDPATMWKCICTGQIKVIHFTI